MNKTYVILGPDGEHDGVPMKWDKESCQWMERPEGGRAYLPSQVFTEDDMFSFPSGELPVGAHTVVCLETGLEFIPLPRGGKES